MADHLTPLSLVQLSSPGVDLSALGDQVNVLNFSAGAPENRSQSSSLPSPGSIDVAPSMNDASTNAAIVGAVWNDIDGDGGRSTNELGLADWVVYLDQNQNGQLDPDEPTTRTGIDGSYQFNALASGVYTIASVNQPGWQSTFPASSGAFQTVELTPAGGVTGVDFGQRALLADVSLRLTPQVSGLDRPVFITHAGDNSDRLFVVEQPGQIRIVQTGTVLATPFLDIRDRVLTGGEQGLLSVAFPANYGEQQHFYVYYTNRAGDIAIARYGLTADPNVADPISEQIILTIDHPTYTNHNGGQLAFGPDGLLYIGTGDGGGGGDPNNNAQNPNSLLGKILRIDVENPETTTYTIPATNPFTAANDPTNLYQDEIWAVGLRNPWRFSFDRQTGDLYIADVGQSALEEVNVQPAASAGGENYGWRLFEGSQPFNLTETPAGLTFPVAEYAHSEGRSITGGYAYRGFSSPALQGVYLYGDFISGNLWGLRRYATGWENQRLLETSFNISTFGEDLQGNLYLADYSRGTLYQIG